MSELENFNKNAFLECGAIFGDASQIYLSWGEEHFSSERPEFYPSFLVMDFHQSEVGHWLFHDHCLRVTPNELRSFFHQGEFQGEWSGPCYEHFKDQFEVAIRHFHGGELRKVVPYVMDRCHYQVKSWDIEHFLAHALKFEQGFIFGRWSQGGGMVGRTPEILISQKGPHIFETMALAGTRRLQDYEENPQEFLDDPKEKEEHALVVEDIVDVLQKFGPVRVEPTSVMKTPHLAHLWTPIRLQTQGPQKLEDLIQFLHPTPALGGLPREKAASVLQKFEKVEPRGSFGAPFAVSLGKNQAKVLVAIRTIQWDQNQIQLGTGCGVVPQSQIQKEWKELQTKRHSVKTMLGVL